MWIVQDMAQFKTAALQKALDDSVPAADLDQANKKFTELTEKYRDLLDKSNSLVITNEQSAGFEVRTHIAILSETQALRNS